MPRPIVLSRPRASSQLWPRAAALALVAVAAASCSDSGRFDSNPFASNRQAPPPQQQQEVTGSIAARPATTARVETQQLPAPSKPATTVASTGGVANGAQGLGAYRPGAHNSDVTGSVPARSAAVPPPPSKQAGGWTWDGGAPVTVGYGEDVEAIARRHGVPAAAIFLRLAEVFGASTIIAPGVGLKEGVLEELVDRHFKVWDVAGEVESVLLACTRVGIRTSSTRPTACSSRVSLLSSSTT